MLLFVARQPILDRSQKVYGYELLFRSNLDQAFVVTSDEERSARVISNSFFNFGLDRMTDSKKAFVNFTPELLTNQTASLFSSQHLVVELLETILPEPAILECCQQLRKAGYTIALDDFTPASPWMGFLKYADLIKVDFLQTTAAEREVLCKKLRAERVITLAEKVETPEQYDEARAAGFDLFQGFFFRHPQLVSGQGIAALKLTSLRLIQAVQRPDFDIAKVEDLIRHDVSLSYRLLKFINSAAFGMRSKVASIKQALVLLGPREVRRWVTIVCLAGMLSERSEEILISSIVRARFCELLAPLAGFEGQELDLYFLGLFSAIDVILERPMQEVIDELPVPAAIRSALLGVPGKARTLLEIVLGYERGDWHELTRAATGLQLDETQLPGLYEAAIFWTSRAFSNEPARE